jgi:preprotein translocase subunit SecB
MATSLQLEGYYFQELSFSVREGMKVGGTHTLRAGIHPQLKAPLEENLYSVHIEVKVTPNPTSPLRWRVELRLSSDDKEAHPPYNFRAIIVGFFRLSSDYTEDELQSHIGRNAPGLLFSAARESLATLTGRGPFPALALPVVVFPPLKELKMPSALRQAVASKKTKRASKKSPAKRAATK